MVAGQLPCPATIAGRTAVVRRCARTGGSAARLAGRSRGWCPVARAPVRHFRARKCRPYMTSVLDARSAVVVCLHLNECFVVGQAQLSPHGEVVGPLAALDGRLEPVGSLSAAGPRVAGLVLKPDHAPAELW